MTNEIDLDEGQLAEFESSQVRGAIDTHTHFWKYDRKRDAWITDKMKLLQKDYLPMHLQAILSRNGVGGCIAVQADCSEVETRFLCELARTNPMIIGVVGWLDFCNPEVRDRIDHFRSYREIRGYRHIVQSEPDDFLRRKDFQSGVRALGEFGYTYDILIYPRQLPAAIEFAGALPGQKLVVDHCAKPEIRSKKMDDWKKGMEELGSMPHVYCKLSGLFTEAAWKSWNAKDFYPYLEVVFQAFGTERLMFGSDWPVVLLSGVYVQWKSLLEKFMENLPGDEKDKVFSKNASFFYNV